MSCLFSKRVEPAHLDFFSLGKIGFGSTLVGQSGVDHPLKPEMMPYLKQSRRKTKDSHEFRLDSPPSRKSSNQK